MFRQIPIQVWLLLSFGAAAFGPARYLFRYNAHSRSRRDITKPPEDLSWRTPEKLYASLAIVVGLAALSFFIFTPTAADFAQSPTFWPLLSAGIGAWALVSVAKGFATGKIMPFVRGATQTYERQTQPKRFWASMSWNAVLGSLMLGMSGFVLVEMPLQNLSDRCYNGRNVNTAQKVLAACNELIAKHRGDQEMASWLAWRGSAYYDLNDFKRARDDYDAAVRLDPKDAASYYNLGLLDERDANVAKAVDDYTRSIRVRPADGDTLLRRGNAFLNTGRFPEALSDFSRAHELNPKDMTSIADRGLTYVWMRDPTSAEKDFATVRTTDPANAIVLRGEALLCVGAGDLRGAVDKLTASLKSEPDNRWALRMRADMYSRLGEEEKYYDDKDALWRLSKVSNTAS